jgi:hypothetical protein
MKLVRSNGQKGKTVIKSREKSTIIPLELIGGVLPSGTGIRKLLKIVKKKFGN